MAIPDPRPDAVPDYEDRLAGVKLNLQRKGATILAADLGWTIRELVELTEEILEELNGHRE